MMKVLITDDEIQIRKGLRMKVDWEEEEFQIVGEASNGQEALELLKIKDVDVLITDMRMPIMDGIELAKRVFQEFPKVRVIVLSGYSDFEYVRGSMKEGVKDYLLKPVAPDELVEVLRKIRKEVEEEKRKQVESARIRQLVHTQMQEVQEQYLLQLVKEEWLQPNLVKERLHQLQFEDLTNEDAVVQFITVEIRESDGNPNRVKELWLPFQMLCKEIAKKHAGTYTFYDPSYANMVHFLHLIDLGKQNSTSSLALLVQQHVKTFLNLETVIGIGNIVTGFTELKLGYISSLLSWSQSQLGSQSQVIDGTVTKKEIVLLSPNVERRLTNAIENVDFNAFKENINKVLGWTETQSVLSFSFDANRVLFLLGSLARKYSIETMDIQSTLWNCQQSIWELNSQRKVIEQLIQLAKLIIERVRITRFSNGKLIVDSVRYYLDQHYASEISLTSLSEIFHINSAYLSETFKNQIGQNFSDYLVNLRMEKALHFLKDKQLKIIDIANLVGFSNSGYFSTVFKKHFDQTPVEFRNSIESIE
ncbi:response regulator transcription factor [Neobacillus ginsengisoli]|uniref:Two-component system response regulator YesN n=1 Tax=Neobacillus ginsengisoli TaxID=904295 RepID=A0ABT9XW79_9BACI|nr:response regulator [Neobacillus ginsengisoli]MDQ0199817.1 two-component system response regulator YesN [Neobacillus ginsengisoli]